MKQWWSNDNSLPCRPHTSWSEVKAKSLSLSRSFQHMEWFEEEKKPSPPFRLILYRILTNGQ